MRLARDEAALDEADHKPGDVPRRDVQRVGEDALPGAAAAIQPPHDLRPRHRQALTGEALRRILVEDDGQREDLVEPVGGTLTNNAAVALLPDCRIAEEGRGAVAVTSVRTAVMRPLVPMRRRRRITPWRRHERPGVGTLCPRRAVPERLAWETSERVGAAPREPPSRGRSGG
jgi:hypothetical protein